MFRTRQFDVSRVAWIRQRLGYAAASVKVVGLFLALEAIFDLLDYLGLVSSLLCALLVFWLGSRVAKQLRSGNGRGVVFAAVYWIAGFALGVDALTKSLRNGLNVYSVSGMLAFIVPLYFLGRGLLAFMSYMAFLRSSQDVEDPLALTPWEISPGRKRHPRFLNKKCLAAYLLVVLTPLPWLVLLIITRRSEILVSNNAVLAGIYAANALIDVGIWVWMPLIYRRARREAMLPGSKLVKRDTRAIVIYLRSFLDDTGIKLRARAANGRILLEKLLKISFEELVTDHLWGYGPVLAIANPAATDQLAPLGAARQSATDANWQEKAMGLIRQSSMIVAITARTPGFVWEMDTIGRMGFSSKLVLLLPPIAVGELEERWRFLTQHMTNLPSEVDLIHTRAVIFPCGNVALITGEKRDDWTYEAVLDEAAMIIAAS